MRKRIFVVSRLRAASPEAVAANVARAERLCRDVVDQGHAPFAPHLLYTRFLNDEVPSERDDGILCGLAFLAACHEVWVDDSQGISIGMTAELKAARELAKPIVYPARWRSIR